MQLKIKSSFTKAIDYRKVLCGKRLASKYYDIRVRYRFDKIQGQNIDHICIRFSVNASKKLGNACTRNFVKRRMRSLAREFIPQDVPAYWMFIVKPLFCNAKYTVLQKQMSQSMLVCKNKYEGKFKKNSFN